jgi:hypothetical protein
MSRHYDKENPPEPKARHISDEYWTLDDEIWLRSQESDDAVQEAFEKVFGPVEMIEDPDIPF